MWVRGLGWERIPRGLRRRSNRGDSFSPPSVLAAEMMSACGKRPLKSPKNQFPAVASDRASAADPSIDLTLLSISALLPISTPTGDFESPLCWRLTLI